MKEIFLALCTRIKAEIPAIAWVDFDFGQLDFWDNPPVAFPCALLKIEYPNCEDLSETSQQVDVRITIRLAFNPLGNTDFTVPQAVRDRALSIFDIISTLHTSLQGYDTENFSCLSRKGFEEEPRPDGLKVFRLVYQTTFEE